MGVRSTNPLQSFIDNFYRSGTDAVTSLLYQHHQDKLVVPLLHGAVAAVVVKREADGGGGGAVAIGTLTLSFRIITHLS